jgi:hypothetical protein
LLTFQPGSSQSFWIAWQQRGLDGYTISIFRLSQASIALMKVFKEFAVVIEDGDRKMRDLLC